MINISAHTNLCAVIGNPVEHSLSPAIHNAAFQANGLDYVYLAFRVDDVEALLTGMRAMPNFQGLSITIPHKMTVMPHLDDIDPMAQKVGSVNTVTRVDSKLIGTTTDGPGTLRAFENAGVSLADKRVLFLGSGGAVRAVSFAVADMTQAEHVTILGRTRERVCAIVDDLQAKTSAAVSMGHIVDDLPAAMANHDIIIQGTPVGMHPNEGVSCVPAHLFRKNQVVFDMVYRPSLTRFLADAEAAGCKTIYGLEMLLNQAALQFERWTDTKAPLSVMRTALTAALHGESSS